MKFHWNGYSFFFALIFSAGILSCAEIKELQKNLLGHRKDIEESEFKVTDLGPMRGEPISAEFFIGIDYESKNQGSVMFSTANVDFSNAKLSLKSNFQDPTQCKVTLSLSRNEYDILKAALGENHLCLHKTPKSYACAQIADIVDSYLQNKSGYYYFGYAHCPVNGEITLCNGNSLEKASAIAKEIASRQSGGNCESVFRE